MFKRLMLFIVSMCLVTSCQIMTSPIEVQPGERTVFVILMENHNWNQIKDSASAPYINQSLLAQGAHAEAYYNPPGLHPSEPKYLWLEAGTNFDVTDDKPPAVNYQASTEHLTTLL